MGGNRFNLNDRVEASPAMKLNIDDREGLEACSELRCCSAHAFGNSTYLAMFRGQEPNDTVGLA